MWVCGHSVGGLWTVCGRSVDGLWAVCRQCSLGAFSNPKSFVTRHADVTPLSPFSLALAKGQIASLDS
eukprot:COSAG06_NODE_39236_length_414_cov_1685.784127_1_plen_67_part_10